MAARSCERVAQILALCPLPKGRGVFFNISMQPHQRAFGYRSYREIQIVLTITTEHEWICVADE
jgi:hypothetical protein